FTLALIALATGTTFAAQWTQENSLYNVNQNPNASDASEYTSPWPGHDYFPSPKNWRSQPLYSLFVDRFSDGDPTNNDFLNQYESDVYEVNFRHGGDIQGLIRRLAYLYALGVRTLQLNGTPFWSNEWHGYNALDFTLLERHIGLVQDFRDFTTAAHKLGMYVMLDLTVVTLGNKLVFGPYDKEFAPFSIDGYETRYRDPGFKYNDFYISNNWDPNCTFPPVWGKNGYPEVVVHPTKPGCYDSDFNQFGDVDAYSVVYQYRRYFGRFASIQDIDAFRIDKGSQFSTYFYSQWSPQVRECAKKFNKNNFWITSEMTTEDTHKTAVYYGRGRQPNQFAESVDDVFQQVVGNYSSAPTFNGSLRPFIYGSGVTMVDSSNYHYPIYFAVCYQLMGNQQTDVIYNYQAALMADDMYNPTTGQLDVRHVLGITNGDIFRWPVVQNGIAVARVGYFLTMVVLSGVPGVYYGEEQDFAVIDGSGTVQYV
ncbi:hypothetical protein HK405_009324, partial [Cladochytrium tenue]